MGWTAEGFITQLRTVNQPVAVKVCSKLELGRDHVDQKICRAGEIASLVGILAARLRGPRDGTAVCELR